MNTVVEVRDCRVPVAEYEFSEFGTELPDARRGTSSRSAGVSIVLTSVALLGGLAGTSVGGAQAGTVTSFVTVNRTERGELTRTAPIKTRISPSLLVAADPAGDGPPDTSRLDSEEVAWVKAQSGLTWDQLGKVFGVSRRAVHMWANGGRLNEANARRLREFSAIIRDIEAGPTQPAPDAVRARLLQVEADGLSIVDRLRRDRAAGQFWGTTAGPERLVDAVRTPLRTPVGEVGA